MISSVKRCAVLVAVVVVKQTHRVREMLSRVVSTSRRVALAVATLLLRTDLRDLVLVVLAVAVAIQAVVVASLAVVVFRHLHPDLPTRTTMTRTEPRVVRCRLEHFLIRLPLVTLVCRGG